MDINSIFYRAGLVHRMQKGSATTPSRLKVPENGIWADYPSDVQWQEKAIMIYFFFVQLNSLSDKGGCCDIPEMQNSQQAAP